MKLSIEDIEKISKDVSDGLQEACILRWWKILLQLGIMILLFAFCFGGMWCISLFTSQIILFLVFTAVWFVLFLWFAFLGFDYIEMKIYFWKKHKNNKFIYQ